MTKHDKHSIMGVYYYFFKKEKNYVPHITIGRVKNISDKEKLSQTLKNLKKKYHGKMEVKKIYIKSSTLTPSGPIYKNIKETKKEVAVVEEVKAAEVAVKKEVKKAPV